MQKRNARNASSSADADPSVVPVHPRFEGGILRILGVGATECLEGNPRFQRFFADADLLAGGRRLLERIPPEFNSVERMTLGGDLVSRLPLLLKRAENGNVVLLASGDPLFFGIARTIVRVRRECGTMADTSVPALEIDPGPCAFQYALAKLNVCSWENARFFSVHGRDDAPALSAMLSAPLAVIYCDGRKTPQLLASELTASYPPSAERPAAIACELGEKTERIVRAPLGAFAAGGTGTADANSQTERFPPLSMLLLLPADSEQSAERRRMRPSVHPPLGLGRPDSDYAHEENMITHPETRAVILSKLALRKEGVLWDLGAGSGSVGLEALELRSSLHVHAVERHPHRVEQIRENARRRGLSARFTLHETDIRSALPELDAETVPDSIFIGGGGRELPLLLSECWKRLRPGGVMVASAVLLDSIAHLCAFDGLCTEHADAENASAFVFERELLTLNVSRALPLRSFSTDGKDSASADAPLRWNAENPILIAVYRKRTLPDASNNQSKRTEEALQ